MRKRLLSGAIVVLLAAVLVMAMAGAATAAGTRWYLCDSSHHFPPDADSYIMSENILESPGTVAIGNGLSVVWIADKEASVATSFPADDWTGSLAILNGAGTCTFELGKWVPDGGDGVFYPYGSVEIDFLGSTVRDNPFEVSVGAFTIEPGERLACRITANEGRVQLHTGSEPDDLGQSWIDTPGYTPPPPVPELPTVALLGAGLAGVAGIIGVGALLRRRSAA